jgi:FKBP-type peptidyl-prolyl cis-trans isomerase 2
MTTEIIKESGLRMVELVEGTGDIPAIGQRVSVHYEIFFGEGTSTSNYDEESETYVDASYDSTYEEKPFNGPIDVVIGSYTPKDDIYMRGQSIKGFDEALTEMKVGGKRKLFIPAALAYGAEGASSFHTFFGYRIAPNRDLACTIELVEIKESKAQPTEKTPKGPAYEAV